jgi:fatty-acyl-CoA synthase
MTKTDKSARRREWSLPAVLDVVTAASPDQEMLVWRNVRRTFAEVKDHTTHLARFFRTAGLGATRERADLHPWQVGQSPVALVMSNCPEYVEAMIGAYRARAVPFNVNHHYHPGELRDLLNRMHTEAIFYHRRFGPVLAQVGVLAGKVLVHVEDGSDVEVPHGSVAYEHALAGPPDESTLGEPSPDDLYLICTGGTTGPPKGVLWRQADIYVSGMGGIEGASPEELRQVDGAGGKWFATTPLMHAAGHRTVFSAVLRGATAVMHDDSTPFDARVVLGMAERERVNMMTIVGDAYARPLIEELQRHRYDLSALQRIGTGGAATSARSKQGLLDLLPNVTIVDSYSSSETGTMASAAFRKDEGTPPFTLSATAVVVSADRTRYLGPGDDEIGWSARRGRIPLGYLDDPAKTTETFPTIAGERVSIPGDRARLSADGTVILLGRDSMVVNTGGEKVYVEEVEDAIVAHPDVEDALVVGRPDDRFGNEVVALVQLRPGAALSARQIREYSAESIARFKAPRAVVFCERIPRHASGKADYGRARQMAESAVPATGE